MAAGSRDNCAGSTGYAFVVIATSVCFAVSPGMNPIQFACTFQVLEWEDVRAYASNFGGVCSVGSFRKLYPSAPGEAMWKKKNMEVERA